MAKQADSRRGKGADGGRQAIMAGNWKMNLNHMEAVLFVQKLSWILQDKRHDYTRVDVCVLPPFVDLRSVQTLVDSDKMKVIYGAQDVSAHDNGAYTGEISGAMLAKLGCAYVVVGHSERRQYHHEDDALVNAKVHAALKHGITPILCVGEGLDVRQADGQVEHTVAQLVAGLEGVKAEQVAGLVIAYEPVWAIGTGEVATPADAQEVCGAIRSAIAERYDEPVADAVRIQYGGSVKSANVAAIMAQPDIDGCLVGGASLEPEEFAAICRYYDLPVLPT